MILFSIAIPVYNVEQYLRPCLDSICRQMADDVELLLCDDGSDDGSGDVCDEYAGKDVRIRVFHQKNRGVSAARNLLIQKAAGKWLIFVDGDDVLAENALQIMRKYADAKDDLIIFGAQKFAGTFHPKKQADEGKEICLSGQEIAELCTAIVEGEYSKFPFSIYYLRNAWAKLWRPDRIRKDDLYFQEGISYGEDMLFVLDAVRLMKQIKVEGRCVYGYRSNDKSVILRFGENASLHCAVLRDCIYQDLMKHGELQDPEMRESFLKCMVHQFKSMMIMSIQHPDCPWKHERRRAELEKICTLDWVREAGEYALASGKCPADLRLAQERKYNRLEFYCMRKRLRYRLVRMIGRGPVGGKFVGRYSAWKRSRRK